MEGEFDREKEWFDLEGVELADCQLGAQLKTACAVHEHNHAEKERPRIRKYVDETWSQLEGQGLVPRKTEFKDLADLTAKMDRCCMIRLEKLSELGVTGISPQNRKRKSWWKATEDLRQMCRMLHTSITAVERKARQRQEKARKEEEEKRGGESADDKTRGGGAPPFAAHARGGAATTVSRIYPVLPPPGEAVSPPPDPSYSVTPHNPAGPAGPPPQMPTFVINGGEISGSWEDDHAPRGGRTFVPTEDQLTSLLPPPPDTTRHIPPQHAYEPYSPASPPVAEREPRSRIVEELRGAISQHRRSRSGQPRIRTPSHLDGNELTGSGDLAEPEACYDHQADETEAEIEERSQRRAGPGQSSHNYNTRFQARRHQSRDRSYSPGAMMPLITKINDTGSSTIVYKPYSFIDLEAIERTLPPIQRGGGPWFRSFLLKTQGTPLACGDLRSILTKVLLGHQLDWVLRTTGLNQRSLECPVDQTVVNNVLSALKNEFPAALTSPSELVLKPREDEDPSAYMARTEEEYIQATGSHPARDDTQTLMYKAAVLQNLPGDIVNKLNDKPELVGAPLTTWQTYVKHFLRKKNEEHKKSEEDTKALERKLLALSLQEKQGIKKKGEIQAPVQTATPTAAFTYPYPPPPPQPYIPQPHGPWYPPQTYMQPPRRPMFQYPGMRGGWSARPRGRYPVRGGQQYASPRSVDYSKATCWICGMLGHISRDCPTVQPSAGPLPPSTASQQTQVQVPPNSTQQNTPWTPPAPQGPPPGQFPQ